MSEIWLHKPYRSLDSAEFHSIKRDICYLYHQLAAYCGVMGDLNYQEVYPLPYWEYLNISGLLVPERVFIQTGCLMMILAMAWETLSDAGSYIAQNNHATRCLNALNTVEGDDANFYRLVEIVKLALNLVQRAGSENDEQLEIEKLSAESGWAFREYVLGYFQRTIEPCREVEQSG